MSEPKITLQIDVDGAAKAKAQLNSVDRTVDKLNSRIQGLASRFQNAGGGGGGGSSGGIVGTVNKWRRTFDQFDKVIKTTGTIALKGLTMSMKFATIEMAAMGAAMLAIHGAFLLGNAAMKAMNAALGPLAAGMTAIVAAAAAATAAVREQQAAMWAYKTKTAPQLGSQLNQTRSVMRGLHADSELATVGIENLNTAYATVSKTSTFTKGSQVLLKGLMDFASAGQPIEEGIKKAAELIATLQDSKKSFSQAKASAQQLFPDKAAVDKAFKDLKITNKKTLEEKITSGELAKAAGLEGQFEAVSGTLINRLKGYMNMFKVQLGDMGQPLLNPLKEAAHKIFNILTRGFVKISANTQRFGMGSMLDGLVKMVEKLTNWSTNLINSNIKSVDGMFSKMSGWWGDFKAGWDFVLDKLRPFIEGAEVIEKMFGATWVHIKNIAASSFGQFNEWLQENEETVIEFGDKVGKLIASIMKFQAEMKKILQDMMPFINDVVGGLSSMVDQMTGFIKMLRGLGGGGTVGALAVFLGLRGAAQGMKNVKGGMVADQVNQRTMTVNAGTVQVNGPIGGPGGAIRGGGNLGTTGAAVGGPPGPGGLASMGPVYGTPPTSPRGPVGPGGPGGPGGLASRSGSFGPGMVPAGNFLTPGVGGTGPSSPLGQPMYGQPGYQPRQFTGRFTSRLNRARNFSYDTFTAPGETDEQRAERLARRTNSRGETTRRAKLRQRSAAQRKARSGPEMSRGNKNLARFQGSASAKMGVGLALGAASQFAPEEAQGALALGGAVGAVNPLAGIAVAGLGTAMKAKTATGGAVSGLAGGAAAGAMIGSFVGPLGTAAGAIIGGLIGGISGAVMGSLNKKKEEVKKSKAAAAAAVQGIVNTTFSNIIDLRRENKGSGKSFLTGAYKQMSKYNKKIMTELADVPGNRKNFAGIVPDFLNRGATGGQTGLAIESATGKRMPKPLRQALGNATMGVDLVGNISAGIISKLGGKSLLDNRLLNPLGFGTNNKKDVDRQKQESKLTDIYNNQKAYGMTISKKDYTDMMKKPGEALKKMEKDATNNEKAMGPLQDMYNKRLKELQSITGLNAEEVENLATSMDVNLMDSTIDMTQVVKDLGAATKKTAEQIRAATVSIVTDGLDVFQKSLDVGKNSEIMNELADDFRNLYDAQGGKVTKDQETEFMMKMQEQYIQKYGEGGQATAEFIKSFKSGGSAFAAGSPFEGMTGVDFSKNENYTKYLDKVIPGLGKTFGADLNAMLLSGGSQDKTIDVNAFSSRLRGIAETDPDKLAQIEDVLANGLGPNQDKLIQQAGSFEQAVLNAIGFGDLKLKTTSKEKLDTTEMSKEIADSTYKLIDQMKIFFTSANDTTPSWYNTPPDWWNKDTTTPRGQAFGDTTSSRLSQTMGRHAAMDSALTGKRTVTSSYRNYGLGSINSDHVTGRAYDLTGQNLGQYQSLVKGSGGFAEFHGVNQARHLHVVPGSGAIGDNTVPVAMNTSPAPLTVSGSGNGNNYNFYVSGNQNASAKEIAEMVMQKVQEIERSNRERR